MVGITNRIDPVQLAKWVKLETIAEFEQAATIFIGEHLNDATQGNQPTTLFLSGGSTPGPIYHSLAGQNLNWHNIVMAQVDERWVSLRSPGSNAALIKRTLLKNQTLSAEFVRMKSRHKSAQKAQDLIEARYRALPWNNSLAVLGMGLDGHVCSWFAGAEGTPQAMDPGNPDFVQAIMAKRSDVTGVYLERMTLTLTALKQCESILLLIKGKKKKALLSRAIKDRPQDLAVTHLLNAVENRMTIMYADVS